MSWDIWLEVDVGGTERQGLGSDSSWNYTYNTNDMLRLAGIKDIKLWAGRQAWECQRDVDFAIKDMEARPDEYKKLNPPNGWGDYDSLLEVLKNIQERFRACPNAYVGGWF